MPNVARVEIHHTHLGLVSVQVWEDDGRHWSNGTIPGREIPYGPLTPANPKDLTVTFGYLEILSRQKRLIATLNTGETMQFKRGQTFYIRARQSATYRVEHHDS